jgi:hypothetical protein
MVGLEAGMEAERRVRDEARWPSKNWEKGMLEYALEVNRRGRV